MKISTFVKLTCGGTLDQLKILNKWTKLPLVYLYLVSGNPNLAKGKLLKQCSTAIDQERIKEMTCRLCWSRTASALLATGRNSSCCSQIACD